MTRRTRGIAIGIAAMLATAAGAQEARAPSLAALKSVETGRWQIHEIGTKGRDRAVCVRDPQRLLQMRHPGQRCARFVIDDTPNLATVHYTCPGAGHGRSTLKVEAPGLIDIQTQGLAGGLPFDARYEARRQGGC
ncbi:hypothetical protein [Sphingomonas japonica]|uniref:DUF3617 family protein n=1 Tax=Sphingomonas japonica TaxID=511662 RepID=A0ABX0U0P1_9SPHN|nr:hypothetical protein [Sphingomonas japonica]NIJ22957.1 hypothetical protein [Sphingomonas japonica]